VVGQVVFFQWLIWGTILTQSSAGWLSRKAYVSTATGVQVTSTGHPYLGAALGSTNFTSLFTQQRVSEWIEGVSHLSTFAETQPHASYAAFTYGYLHKWNYYFCTTPTCFLLLSLLFVATFFPS